MDSDMLKKLDELEEHPKFYERTEEKILLALETALKPGKTFEEVIRLLHVHIYLIFSNAISLYLHLYFSSHFFLGERIDESLDILSAKVQILPTGQYHVRILQQQRKSRAQILREVCPRSILRS